MPITSNVTINEGQVIFKRSDGHKHDGLTSSLIDTKRYSMFDFVPAPLSSDPARVTFQENNKNIFKTFIIDTIEERVLNPKGIRIQANTITANEIATGTITANELIRDFIMVNNTMRSNTFNGTIDKTGNITLNGTTGWAISHTGKTVFNDVTIRGNLITGNGYYNASNTPLFSNSAGYFSLKDRLTWDPSTSTLTINGTVSLSNTNIGTFDNGDALTGGSIGGVTISSNKIYAGGGNWANADTAFYLDNSGYFSLEDKLYWNPSSNLLTISGNIIASNITGSTLTSDNGTDGVEIANGKIRALNNQSVVFTPTTGSDATYIKGGIISTEQISLSDGTDDIEIAPGAGFYSISAQLTSATAADSTLRLRRSGSASNSRFINFQKTDGTNVGYIRYQTGNGAIEISATSDERLKTKLDYENNSLNLIKKIETKYFYWKNDESQTKFYGVFAQDLHKYMPELVDVGDLLEGRVSPTGEFEVENSWKVNYSGLIPYLVGAVQQLSEKVDYLEARVQTLEGV